MQIIAAAGSGKTEVVSQCRRSAIQSSCFQLLQRRASRYETHDVLDVDPARERLIELHVDDVADL